VEFAIRRTNLNAKVILNAIDMDKRHGYPPARPDSEIPERTPMDFRAARPALEVTAAVPGPAPAAALGSRIGRLIPALWRSLPMPRCLAKNPKYKDTNSEIFGTG
jgi:hypothetical protein